jgi:hypothetical protein
MSNVPLEVCFYVVMSFIAWVVALLGSVGLMIMQQPFPTWFRMMLLTASILLPVSTNVHRRLERD